MDKLIDHRERLMREPHWRDMRNWPAIDPDSIERSKRSGYRRNRQAVQMALAGTDYQKIKASTGLHPAQITRLLQRALSAPEDVTPALTQALIPGRRLRPPMRRKPLGRLDAPSGASGAFQHLLDTVPDLRANLDTVIKHSLRHGATGENLTPAGFHAYLMLFLRQAGHPEDCYPYTHDSLGIESARQYFHARTDYLLAQNAVAQVPARSLSPNAPMFEVGRETQIDEHTYHGESSVYLELSGKVAPVRIARFSLVVVDDVDTTCHLSFRLAFTQHCSQFDVLSALEDVMIPREPAVLVTPGIHVPPGACFPNQLDDVGAASVAFNTVALDNALAHCARSVEQHICEHHFGTSGLGLPGTPKRRNVIERAMRLLARHARRHKSTSGSHPKDPIKETNHQKKKPPVVTVFELEEAIYAVLAKDNRTPKPHLMGSSPLDAYRYGMREYPLRLLPEDGAERRSPFTLTKVVPVKWLKKEGRSPHINFYSQRYNGACLAGLGNQDVTVIYDYRDIRVLQVKTADGNIVGTVRAPRSWQHFAHGVKTRQYITAYCRRFKVRMQDPLTEYFWLQIKRRNQARAALEMIRLYREYTGMTRPLLPDDDEPLPPPLSAPDPIDDDASEYQEQTKPSRPLPAWSTEIANAHRTR